jgi:hypothetical protein
LLDVQSLRAVRQRFLAGEDKKKTEGRLVDVWQRLFHSTFADTEDEFCDALFTTTMESLKLISLSNLDSTLRVLEEFDRMDQARALLDKIKTTVGEKAMAEDPLERIQHPGLRAFVRAFVHQARGAAAIDKRPIGEVIESATREDFIRPTTANDLRSSARTTTSRTYSRRLIPI